MRAHDVFEVTLDVTEKHIYGSGGTSICYQFDVQAFDIGFGIWCGALILRAWRAHTHRALLADVYKRARYAQAQANRGRRRVTR